MTLAVACATRTLCQLPRPQASAANKKKAARTSWCIGMHKANVQV
jgi:hypothetical protein